MEGCADFRGLRRSKRKGTTDDSTVASKKQRTGAVRNVAQLHHTSISNGGELDTSNQLVLYKHRDNRVVPFPVGNLERENRIKLYSLMVQNICKACTAVSLGPRQPERIVHFIFEDECMADAFVQPLFQSHCVQVKTEQDTYFFYAAKDTVVGVSWIHCPDDEDAADEYIRELKQFSRERESFFVLAMSGAARSRSGIQKGQVVPIGGLSFSSSGESRTSLFGGRPRTFHTRYNEELTLNDLLQACTRIDVWNKQLPKALCKETEQDGPLHNTYSVVIDKHPVFVRKLVEQYGTRQALCVMAAITEHVKQAEVVDQEAVPNTITLLHTFLAAGIDTVFPYTPQDTTTRRLERPVQPMLQNQPLNTRVQTSSSMEVNGRPAFSLPETPDTPDAHRQPVQTGNLFGEPNRPSDAVLLKIASKLSKSDARKLGVVLDLDMTTVDNILQRYSQHSVEQGTLEVLSEWKKERGKTATARVLEDALRSIRRNDVADDLEQYLFCCEVSRPEWNTGR